MSRTNPIARYRIVLEPPIQEEEGCSAKAPEQELSKRDLGESSQREENPQELDRFQVRLEGTLLRMSIPDCSDAHARTQLISGILEVQETVGTEYDWLVRVCSTGKLSVQVLGVLYSWQKTLVQNGRRMQLELDALNQLPDSYLVPLLEKFDVTMIA
jgi:hypothetical protein